MTTQGPPDDSGAQYVIIYNIHFEEMYDILFTFYRLKPIEREEL